MASSFFHGITTTIIDSGPRPIAVPSSSIIDLIDTYTPGADLVQPDVPVQITNPREAAQAFGQNSAITRAINAIYARTSAVIVATGVTESKDTNALTSGIIGGVTAGGVRTGLQSMLDAKSCFNVQPRLLIAPGFSARQPVATAMDGLADKLRAVSIIDGPGVRTWDTTANAEVDALHPLSLQACLRTPMRNTATGRRRPTRNSLASPAQAGPSSISTTIRPAARTRSTRPASPPSFAMVATACGAIARCRPIRNGRSSRACVRSTSLWMQRRPVTNGPSTVALRRPTCTRHRRPARIHAQRAQRGRADRLRGLRRPGAQHRQPDRAGQRRVERALYRRLPGRKPDLPLRGHQRVADPHHQTRQSQ